VSVVTRARTDTSKRNAAMTLQADKNDSHTIVILHLMNNVAVDHVKLVARMMKVLAMMMS